MIPNPLVVLPPRLQEVVLRFEGAARDCTRSVMAQPFSMDKAVVAAVAFRRAQHDLIVALVQLVGGVAPPEPKPVVWVLNEPAVARRTRRLRRPPVSRGKACGKCGADEWYAKSSGYFVCAPCTRRVVKECVARKKARAAEQRIVDTDTPP